VSLSGSVSLLCRLLLGAILPGVLLGACHDEAPALPPPLLQTAEPPIGRLVRAGDLLGFLARPSGGDTGAAQLHLAPALDEDTRATALAAAREGVTVLAIPPEVSTQRGRAYLERIASGEITVRCTRSECPR